MERTGEVAVIPGYKLNQEEHIGGNVVLCQPRYRIQQKLRGTRLLHSIIVGGNTRPNLVLRTYYQPPDKMPRVVWTCTKKLSKNHGSKGYPHIDGINSYSDHDKENFQRHEMIDLPSGQFQDKLF